MGDLKTLLVTTILLKISIKYIENSGIITYGRIGLNLKKN